MDGPRPNPGARIPVKLAQDVVGRLTDRVLLVRPGRVEAVVLELQKMGHTPQVVSR
jgi:hypothetical protein